MYPIQIRNPRTHALSTWCITRRSDNGERYHVLTVGARSPHYAWVDGAGTAYLYDVGGELAPSNIVPAYVRERCEQEHARDLLREFIKPGDRIATILRHVSNSGMMRRISVVVVENGNVRDVSRLAAIAAGLDWDRDKWQIRMGGCGYDVGFQAVYSLAYALFGDGFECIGEGCPSNDHSNGDREYTPHMHSDAGYALRQEWL